MLLPLPVLAGAVETRERSVRVFERRAGGMIPNLSTPRRSGAFPAARAIHSFDRPSLEGRRRLRERAERRPLRGVAADVDNWRVAVIRISFRTNRAPDLTSMRADGNFDLTPDGTAIIDPTPHDRAYFDAHMQALARYYEFQSCGVVEITWDILPHGDDDSYRLSDVADYGPGSGGSWTVAMLVRFVRDAVEACDAALAAEGYPVRISDYDAIVLAHAGANLQSDIRGDSPNDIPSFFARLGDGDAIAVEGGAHIVTELSVIPETAIQDGYNGGIAAVLAHEFGHQLGLPDLYDIYAGLPTVGYFDNMDSGGLLGAVIVDADGRQHYAEGFIPGGLSAWSRYVLGWTRADTVRTFENSLSLPAVEKCPARLARVEAAADEYFLFENRAAELDGLFTGAVVDQQTGVILGLANCLNCAEGVPDEVVWGEFTNGYDLLLPTESLVPGPDGGPGLLAWRVNEYFIARRWDANEVNSRWPFGITLVEANGVVDLGDPSSRFMYGWYDDAFYAGNATEMSDSTLPPAWSSWMVPTGVRLEGVSGRDTLMTFGAGVRAMRATKMIGGDWRAARHGVLQLPGEFRMLVIDERGNGRLAGGDIPVFSLSGADGNDRPVTPAAYAEAFDQATGAGAVILAGRSGTLYAFRDGDWSACAGSWPLKLDTLATHPVPVPADGASGPFVAAATRNGALFLVRRDGTHDSPWLDGAGGRFIGNLVVQLEEHAGMDNPSGTGIFALVREPEGPAGIRLRLFSTSTGAAIPEPGFDVFVAATRDELAGPVFLVGGRILPQREGSELWIVFGSSGRSVLCGEDGIVAERRLGVALTEPPAVADINADGRLDLVCTDGDRIFCIDPSGANITGWPRSVNSVFALPTGVRVSGPPVAVTESGRSWVAAVTDAGILFLFDGRGALAPGWPRKTASSFRTGIDCVPRGDEGLLVYIDQVFNDSDEGFGARRPEGGRARWRAAPFGAFDPRSAWCGVFAGPGRSAFALRSEGGGEARPWTGLASNLVIYPNPSDGRRIAFHFSAPDNGEARLQVFALTGEIVLERSKRLIGGEDEFAVSMSGSAPGIYLCRIVVTSGGRTVEARRKFAIVN